MSTVAIIQARMGSTRLPGKVLKPLLGVPMLSHVVQRVQKARLLDDVVIATSTLAQDDPIEELCQDAGWQCVRGSESDVLGRYHQAAVECGAASIVRITSDCPLIDPQVVDYVVSAYLSSAPSADYASNSLNRTYPRGLDTEIFSRDALSRCHQQAGSPQAREHVTYHMYQHPEQFSLHSVENPADYSHYRWTVDTSEDLAFARTVYDHFGHRAFSWQDALQALQQHPDWVTINQHIEQKKP